MLYRVTRSSVQAPIEQIVRPFVPPKGWQVPRRLPPEQDGRPAYIEWSASVRPEITTLQAMGSDLGDQVLDTVRDDEGEDIEDEPLALVLRETRRTVSIVRVRNPANPAMYVDVERTRNSTFGGNDGTQFSFEFLR